MSNRANDGTGFGIESSLKQNAVQINIRHDLIAKTHYLIPTARAEYKNIRLKVLADHSVIAPKDMKKLIILFRMPGIKTCILGDV